MDRDREESRHGQAGPAFRVCTLLFTSECDPGLCEAEQVPTCRQDQVLIEGRLGDSCCTSYFCGRWLWAVHQPPPRSCVCG